MCLAVPGKIVEIKEDVATVDYELEKREGKIMEPGFQVGDYVIIQGGIVIEKVEKDEAIRALKSYKDAVA